MAKRLDLFDVVDWSDDRGLTDWLEPLFDQVWLLDFNRIVDPKLVFLVHIPGVISDTWSGDDSRHLMLINQPLAEYIEVQHTQKATSESRPKSCT